MLRHSNENIVLTSDEKEELISAAADAYEKFLTALKIDWKHDLSLLSSLFIYKGYKWMIELFAKYAKKNLGLLTIPI